MRTLAEFLVAHLVELVMFTVGLRARPAQVFAEIRRPHLLLRELLVIALGVPLLTLLVVRLLPLPPWTAVVAILFGISPTAPSLIAGFRRESVANKALAVITVALASSMIVVPLWVLLLNYFGDLSLRVSAGSIFALLALRAFAPLLGGMLIGRSAPRVAQALERVLTVVVLFGMVLVVVLLLHLGAGLLRLITVPILLGLLLISVGSAVLGEIAGGRDLELREILGRVAMSGNPAIALAIIGTSYPDLDLAGLVAAYILCRAAAAIPYTLLARHRIARRQRREPPEGHGVQPS